MKLYIKYMVSLRCKLFVKDKLDHLGISHNNIELGTVEIAEPLSPTQKMQLQEELLRGGLELLDDKRQILIEKIKNVVIEMIHYSTELPQVNYSSYISDKLNYDYTYLANIFSEVKGITLQQYIINHKIEKVKELMLYDQLSLTEIAHQLGYSSTSHLSAQFKKITGLSPTFFKKLKIQRMKNLENL